MFALIAVAVADPKPQILSATPLLAKIAGPEAPASTDHAAHVAAPIVAAYSAPVVASYSAPLAYNAFASPLAYNERYVYPSPVSA